MTLKHLGQGLECLYLQSSVSDWVSWILSFRFLEPELVSIWIMNLVQFNMVWSWSLSFVAHELSSQLINPYYSYNAFIIEQKTAHFENSPRNFIQQIKISQHESLIPYTAEFIHS